MKKNNTENSLKRKSKRKKKKIQLHNENEHKKKQSIGGGKLNIKKLCQQITKLQFSFTIQWSDDSVFLRVQIQLEISGK